MFPSLRHGAICSLAALTLLACVLSRAAADDVAVAPSRVEAWKPMTFPKIDKTTAYTTVRDDDAEAILARAECSASALYVAVDVDLTKTPLLTWRWKATQAPTAADERRKDGDDFAARVYVMFRFDAQRASWWARARHRLGTAIYGDIVPGNAINYVWSSQEPAGASWENPFSSEARMIVVGRGAMSEWRQESVDVAADYEKYFGSPLPPLLAVAVMSDSDNTCSQAGAYFADFRFRSR